MSIPRDLRVKLAVERNISGSISAFVVGSTSVVNIFDRDGRSQDLPDIYRILASAGWNPSGVIIQYIYLE
jgi:hypothetical protein